jgi:hypothetical protein
MDLSLDAVSADPPQIASRSDGQTGLIYVGLQTLLAGPPESGKGLFAHRISHEQMQGGGHVFYFDFEDTPEAAIERQLALGTAPELLVGDERRFFYIRPEDGLDAKTREAVLAMIDRPESPLVILDGLTEAYVQNGFAPNENADAARFNELLPKPAKHLGATVLLIDHVPKNPEARGGYSIGAQHKRAHVDVLLGLSVIEDFGRGRDGSVKVTLHKDRPGHLRRHQCDAKCIAVMRLASGEDGRLSIDFDPPADQGETEFRPTKLMEKASKVIEQAPGIAKRELRGAVVGKNSYVDLALRLLDSEDFIEIRPEGPAYRHYSLKRYREIEDAPPGPNGDFDFSDPLATRDEEARAAELGLSLNDEEGGPWQ